MRPTALLLALSAGFSIQPCLGQGVPPNPFASNYPSAAPSRAERAQTLPTRRRPPPRRIEAAPVPPVPIPGERGGAVR